MSSSKCLAIRVSGFMSVQKYRRTQQETNFTVGAKVYEPYSALVKEEKKYLPGSREVKFTLDPPLPGRHCEEAQSFDPYQNIPQNFPELELPNMKAQQYHYDQAVAMMIMDVKDEIDNGLKKAGEDPSTFDGVLTVHLKDGCDGMGEIKCKQHKTTKGKLPDKAVRFSATLLKITYQDKTIFEESKANSQLNARPFFIALADENDYYAVTSLMDVLMQERKHVEKAVMSIENGEHHPRRFTFKLYATMYDEKLERKMVGLAGSSSEFLCTMCETTRGNAFANPFQSSQITRTADHNMMSADRFYTNDSSKSYRALQQEAKGIKADAFTDMTPHIDALHCEINNALWLKKLIIREIAGLTDKWSYRDANSKQKLQDAEEKLNEALRRGVGLQKHLMQPGNYSRQFTEQKAVNVMLELIPEARREIVQQLIDKYNLMKVVWKSSKPTTTCPDLVHQYCEHARALMDILKGHFEYMKDNMPNYLHKVVAHVPELIDKFGSVGLYSSEANEHGNKLFRLFRRMNARQNTNYELQDILKYHWLYTCRRLQHHVGQERQQICSKCKCKGHKSRACLNEF